MRPRAAHYRLTAMKSRLRFGALLALVAIAAAGAVEARGKDKATVEHRYPGLEKARERDEPEGRAEWQKPGRVLLLLALAEGDTVADLGAGTGYMVPLLSGAVGEVGQVYAVDIEQELVDHAASRPDLPYANVVAHLAEPDDPKLPAGELDLILIVNTWHHIDDRRDYLKKIVAALAPGGRVAVIDWVAEETEIGPPMKHRLSKAKVIAEFERELALAGDSVLLPHQYFLLFTRQEDLEPRPIEH